MTESVSLSLTPKELRLHFRRGGWGRPTAGLASGYVQANLAILPRAQAFDFLLFCQRNPRPCPLIEVLEAGVFEPAITAPGADIRTDLPRYRIYQDGALVAEVPDIMEHWRDDLVSFLLGCSFTFEAALASAGMPPRHVEEGKNVPMYITNVATAPAGHFSGPMVVSMRSMPSGKVVKAVQVTSRFPNAHGAPIHIGDPDAIGIRDLARPDYGDAPTVRQGEVPVFWACGVTPQAVAIHSRPPLMITHAPGYMFITDLRDEELAVL
ncbi:MAG: putative hydro-lyase [Chloroflexi bacterium]|nr:putative hydro-lyase [Chloroflexota bacterium]